MGQGERLSRQAGFTLVEIMVALGLASAAALGVSQVLLQSQKASKTVSVTSDWNSLVGLVQNSLNNDDVCTAIFAQNVDRNGDGSVYVKTTAPGKRTYDGSGGENIPVLAAAQSDGTGSTLEIVKKDQDYGGYTVTKLRMDPSGLAASELTIVAPPLPDLPASDRGQPRTFKKYQMRLAIEGTRPAGPGGPAKTLTARPIPFTLITGPQENSATRHQILSCFGESSPSRVCSDIGGTYSATANPPCQMDSLFMSNRRTYTPRDDNGRGQRIQLSGEYGRPRDDDWAIGLGDDTFWFNAGHETKGTFLFTHKDGDNTLLTLGTDTTNYVSAPPSCTTFFGIRICLPNAPYPVKVQGAQIGASLKVGTDSDDRDLYVTGGAIFGHSVKVNGILTASDKGYFHDELTVETEGDSASLNLTNKYGASASLANWGSMFVVYAPDNMTLSARTDVVLSAGEYPDDATATLDASGDFTVTTLKGKVKASKGGTVPFSCRQVTDSCSSNSPACSVACGTDEFAVAGGGKCHDELMYSHPSAPASGKKLGTGWDIGCKGYSAGHGSMGQYPRTAYAICCKF